MNFDTEKSVVSKPDEEMEANAELICRAVNNFEPMLEALKDMVLTRERGRMPEGGHVGAYKRAKEAINNATKPELTGSINGDKFIVGKPKDDIEFEDA